MLGFERLAALNNERKIAAFEQAMAYHLANEVIFAKYRKSSEILIVTDRQRNDWI